MKKNTPGPAATAVLVVLRGQPDPVGIGALAQILRKHPNTLREQIAWLLRNGFIRRVAAPSEGRGRPAWLYEATTAPDPQETYADLAAELAWQIVSKSAEPLQDALHAGRHWGDRVARDAAPTGPGPAARAAVVRVMDQLGYAPDIDGADDVILRHCPMLQVAHEYPDVVCNVHLGLVQALLAHHGDEPASAELEPFSGPGTCTLRFRD